MNARRPRKNESKRANKARLRVSALEHFESIKAKLYAGVGAKKAAPKAEAKAEKAPAKKAPAKKTTEKKPAVKKTTAKKAPAKKAAEKK